MSQGTTSLGRLGPGTSSSGLWSVTRRISGGDWVYRLIALIVIAIVWQVGASQSTGILIPTFLETMGALIALLPDPELWRALLISNQALVIGFALTLVIGIPLGLAMGRFTDIGRFTDFYLSILLVTPMAAIIPILIMVTGLGLESRVILVVLSSLVIVVVNARAGVRQVDPSLLEMARSFQASEWQIWRKIVLPNALPAVMSGIRLGLSQAVGAMIVIELLMIAVGIGAMMIEFRGRFLADYLYATVVIVVAEALLLVLLINRLERWLTPWRRSR